ncbi:hypothetical protein [Antarcticimicrobium luteum]|uniref:Uncharacterized protein n=1 Tax=Antarcticimicrobium luteum TaxID=2547397 RepID=A0A4R5UQD3_9RHOB|nr:hypothetical protein [Antarcticimicrobium luteum]TDK41260.1 hypothetical protein E1832_21485 [Antarcticimicrobium luteum]
MGKMPGPGFGTAAAGAPIRDKIALGMDGTHLQRRRFGQMGRSDGWERQGTRRPEKQQMHNAIRNWLNALEI